MKRYSFFALLVLALCLPMGVAAQYAGEHFIMHTSGLHLGKSATSGILESATAANPVKMKIIDAGSGYYRIQAPDGTYFAKKGAKDWNTGFEAEATGDNTLFQFEVSGMFVKIKNKVTGKYLGTDNTTANSSVFCDKDGNSANHLWYLADVVNAPVPVAKYSLMVNPGAPRQEFDGWGISLCWWANMCGKWSDDKIDQIIDWLVLPENLNYRIFRYNIGGGDDPDNAHCTLHHMGNGKGLRAEMPGFKKYEDSEYDWSADEAQIKIMRKIKERRPDAIFEAFSNSAPWWMTYSGCCSGASEGGSDNLKPEYYEAFADYLIDVMKHMKEVEGIEFATVAPFNEPMTSFWHCSGVQEGCHFDVKSMSNFIKVMYPKLQASGLNTVISGCDETSVAQQIGDVQEFKKAGSLGCLGQINTHTYQGDTRQCCALSAICAAEGIPLWMSEVGSGGSGIQGNLNMAIRLIRDMRYIEPLVWCDWQYMEEANDQWCLIQGNFAQATPKRVNNYYVRQHFTRYIKPGYTIITSTHDNTLAALSPDGSELVLVVVNPDANKAEYTIDLGMFNNIGMPVTAIKSRNNSYDQEMDYELKDSYLYLDMPSLTIATFVIPVGSNLTDEVVDGGEYYILPRRSATDVITARGGKVCLQPADLSDDQIWKASISGGKVKFTNREGKTITAGSGYDLSASTSSTGTQAFSLVSVGQQYYKIEANGKVFDLSGDNSTTGTGVGMWAYGDDPAAATHRQWRFMPITERSEITPTSNSLGSVEMTDLSITSADGAVSIEAPEAGRIIVAALDGRVLYSATASSAAVSLPAGIYAVSFAGQRSHAARLISIR